MPARNLSADVRTEAELDALAEINAGDVDDAALAWRQDAPAPWRKLLDATLDTADTDTTE